MLELFETYIYNVALYIRLSKEDADKGYDESESIKNQKDLLNDYVQNLGTRYNLVDFYIDHGYTGTNFNRPAFQKMILDIENKKVNMVITKDLSRLGRDYIETGEYVEKWFPEHNVRYIAVTDGIDTFEADNGNNDIAPFKSILNDMYSKDLSKKVKTALNTMKKQGKWVGGKTSLGYMKDPEDKNHLVICEDEAKIIRIIFDLAYSGKGLAEIRDWLEENNIPTPHRIRYNKMSYWENRTIKNILTNRVYVGITEQSKRSKMSYKNKKLIVNPREKWVIVEGTHEPIIDKDKFNAIQKMVITQRYARTPKKYSFLLEGLLFCYECKHRIGFKRKKDKYFYLVCNTYRRNSRIKLCTPHNFAYKPLENRILEYIRMLFLAIDSNQIELNVKNGMSKHDCSIMLSKIELDIKSINDNIDKMYIDKLNGKISEEMYERLSNKLMNDIKEKKEEYIQLENMKNDMHDDSKDIKKIVKEFLELEEPTPEVLKMLINRVEIHQDKQVDIIFNFRKLNDVKF